MSRFKNLINEVLYEKYDNVNEENKGNQLKLFYEIDILITRMKEKLSAAEGGEAGETGEEQGQIYRHKKNGEVLVPKERAENIQNLENLLNYTSNIVEDGKPIINELVVETIKTAAGIGQGAIGEIFDEDDKMIVDLDYGFSKEDSVGVKINKGFGSEVVSFSMKKDGNILPADFNYNTFNNQLLSLRERYMEA